MSTQTTDVAAWLDGLEEARKAATPGPWFAWNRGVGWNLAIEDPSGVDHLPGRPYLLPEGLRTDLARAEDAALIVAAVNALPELVAVVRGVIALAEEWGGLPTPDQSHGDWGGYHDGHDSGLRSAAARLQDVVAAAHTEEGR